MKEEAADKIQETKGQEVIGWLGTFSGLSGAILLALNLTISGYGYVLFLTSSMSLSYWFWRKKVSHQLLNQLGFTVINSIGVYRWLIA